MLLELFQSDRRRRQAGAAHLDAVVEHPDLDGGAAERVIAVRDGVDQGLLPGEARILETLAKKQVVSTRPLPDMFLDPTHRFVDQANEGCLETNTLDHIQRSAVPPLGPSYLTKSMPQRGCQRRIFGEKKQAGHVGNRLTPRRIQQMIE
jgi:hypothetical protein